MKFFFFKSAHGNFGDDLNAWLWPKLFGAYAAHAVDTTFVGIGSILDERLDKIYGEKIVFGSGIRSLRNLPRRDSELHIRFVRGPISAMALGNDTKFITDPAILVSVISTTAARLTTNAIGFMPHYASLHVLDWKKLCARMGWVFIDPRGDVENTIALLLKCDRLITEAMHGAIVADTLRIPWHRISLHAWRLEEFDVSSLKWLDWGLSTRVDVTPTHLGTDLVRPSHPLLRVLNQPLQYAVRRRVVRAIEKLQLHATYQLSSEVTWRGLLARMQEEVQSMHRWLEARRPDTER